MLQTDSRGIYVGLAADSLPFLTCKLPSDGELLTSKQNEKFVI